jgi:predicted glycosyltransferase
VSAPRVLIWVQHLLGTGHLRRAHLLAAALAERGARVVLASGGPPVPWSPAPGVELVQLPPIRAADSRFSTLATAEGTPVDDGVWAARRAILEERLEALRPQILVSEHYPFGRGAFARELEPLLARATALGTVLVASVRDVLVSKADPAKHRAALARAAAYRRVLVHGDPALIPFAASFSPAAELGSRLVHTGYLAGPIARSAERGDEVVVSAGGGAVGRALRAVAIEAAASLPDRPWRIVGGPVADPDELAELAAKARPGVIVEGHRADLPELVARAAVSVSQAGYNTVVETLASGTPMVLVPFAEGGEDEQTRRAEALAARGLARVLPEAELSPAGLARAVLAALAEPPTGPPDIRLDGTTRSVELLLDLLA